jgi:ABC transporter
MKRRRCNAVMTKNAASPSATGPGGPLLEAKVGAFYLLAMLLNSEPRGLPGSRIARIRFQGATDDLPLDDVVVHALTQAGLNATLDIQVKRSIKFSPSDAVFEKVLSQIAEVLKSGKLDAADPYLMGIATAQISRKIDGPYQEILQWARRSQSASSFFRKLNHPKVANEDMRTFVTTIRTRLDKFDAPFDDDTVWKVLCHLQIFVFDFSDDGQSETLVRERCRQALDAAHQDNAGALWSTLIEIAQALAVAAGEIDLEQLRQTIAEKSGLTLVGTRQNREALIAVAEASRHAMESIRDSIAGAHLSRRARLDHVNSSLDRGRYVEILGDAGVGKSGILRALAEELTAASNVIVLTPARVTPRGWSAFRNEIGYQGSAADLLSNLASSGGGTIFVDSVDMLGDDQRATVNDLVREAARIPGFNVVVTARRSFGIEEPNWLPAKALDELGRAPSVVIDELTDDEVDELRTSAPELASLLSSDHPAKDAVRNLFRLEWLYQRGQQDQAPRTEAEMARLWWKTGDGKSDDGTRDRTRVLRGLAKLSLTGPGPYPAAEYYSAPLNALIRSGTLLEPRAERVVFRHDVFRDWSIANLLEEDESTYETLPLTRPAPASLFRGVELAARIALEGHGDAKDWSAILQRLRAPAVNASWQRAAILALVRSENSAEVLSLAEADLLAQDGAILGDLIRTVMAVDTMPVSEVFAQMSVALPAGLEKLAMPVGPAWRRLIVWILQLGNRLPAATVADVIKLYVSYATSVYVVDPIAGTLVEQLHAWLMMMEGSPSPLGESGPPKPTVERDRYQSLHEELRSAFLALCTVRPALAEHYLGLVLKDKDAARTSAEQIVMSPGNLAAAAPALLAELTAKTLISDTKRRARRYGNFDRQEPFTHTDAKFLSPAPSRGPFLGLLNSAPTIGLSLIRQIVNHASTFDGSRSRDARNDAVTILLANGPRRFTNVRSYFWSRDGQGRYSVTSALMALEAWSHDRIDRGDDVDAVIADILGDGEMPAAFLLLVVDVILSHWAKAWRSVVPFAASPELLAWDRSRQVHDYNAARQGRFGDPEPKSAATREGLQKQSSRGVMLERVLPIYTLHAPPDVLADLRSKLCEAARRLGPYEPSSDFGDPRFMVRYALNTTDRGNYQPQDIISEDGTVQSVQAYVSPPEEAAHLKILQDIRSSDQEDAGRRAELSLALDDIARSSSDLVARAVPWAKKIQESGTPQESFDNSILIAAFVLMRDGTTEQRHEYGTWAVGQFERAARQPEDAVHRVRDGLMFNPIGIATAGLVIYASYTKQPEDVRRLFEVASRGDPAAARGFGAFRDKLEAIDRRLAKSVLRCAFGANVRPRLKRCGDDRSEDTRRQAQVARWREKTLEAEWSWLSIPNVAEPKWPLFPEPPVDVRAPMYLDAEKSQHDPEPREDPAYYVDHEAAGIWLQQFMGREYTAPPWMREIADRYRDWTARLNGAGLDSGDELTREPNGWNQAYFVLVSRSLVGLNVDALDQLCVQPIVGLPDRSFLHVMEIVILALDQLHFEGKGPDDAEAVRIRTKLIDRLRQTWRWRHFSRNPGYGIPLDFGGALGAAFLCQHVLRQPPRCYVTAIGIARAEVFTAILTELAEATPSLFVAKAVLSIASVSADHPFVQLSVKAIAACLNAFPNDTKLWVDYSVGDDFCSWLDRSLQRFGTEFLDRASLRGVVEGLLANLIRLGVSSAAPLEQRVAAS